MNFNFHKYQGTGNDFIMIDDRAQFFPTLDHAFIALCCHRRFGIGADGLILVQPSDIADFKMVYFNSDGRESTLCGNGARCTVAFANALGIIKEATTFEAIDGLHTAQIKANKDVALRMHDVKHIRNTDTYAFLDTGSPHHVEMVTDLAAYPVIDQGAAIRYGDPYFQEGSNVNFVEQKTSNTFAIRTYERGVENETLSCGTGATAVAIAMHYKKMTTAQQINILVEGGELSVSFLPKENEYTAIDLMGPTQFVYSGKWK